MSDMTESTFRSGSTGTLRQPWGTLSGMLTACIVMLWCVAHDFPVDVILSRSLLGGLLAGCVIRLWTLSWSVFFPKT
jgi:hypothetical protein